MVTGFADQVVEAGAFAAEDEDAVAGEVELVVVAGAALVETDDPHVLLLQVFKGADEVDDAGDTEVFGCSGAGFDGDGAERGGAAFGEDDAIDACAVGYAEKSAEVLRVFYAVECEEQAMGAVRRGRVEVFNGEEFLGADHGDYALMGGGFGQLGELVARLLTDADAGLAEGGDQLFEAKIVALAGYKDVVKAAAAGFEGFFDRMHAVEDFHEG